MRKQSYRISRPDAPSLHLQEWGCGKPTFLLVHGFGDGGFIWNEFVPSLMPYGRVIVVDLRGHGDSDWDISRRYSSREHVVDVAYLFDALKLNNVVLVGHSLGGEIAIRITNMSPGRIVGLVIVDFGPKLNRAATAHIRKEFAAESRIYSSYREYAAHLSMKLPLISSKLSETLAEAALRLNARGGYELKRDPAMCAAEPADEESLSILWSMLEDIRCPTLIVRGVASSVFPISVAQRMADIIRNASLVSIKFAGHAVMTDNPAGFTAAVMRFLRDTSSAQPKSTQVMPTCSSAAGPEHRGPAE